jgi:heat shock protein HslJ
MAQAQALPWGTQWELVRAADPSVDWTAVHATFGLQEQRAGGKAPVNRYFGACRELADGHLELGPFGMTMMAGPPHAMVAEQVYLALLERVRTFRASDGELVLADADGQELLGFVPAADPEQA